MCIAYCCSFVPFEYSQMNDRTGSNKFVHRTESLVLCGFSFALK